MNPTIGEIATRLDAVGLALLGAFHPTSADGVPAQADGRPSRTLVLAGNVGGSLWPAFSGSAEAGDGGPDPLDRWSARIVGGLAAELDALAVFPFGGPPYHPFQRWGLRAAPLTPSPIGVLIHPDHGLWHAFRGGLALPEALLLPPADTRPSPCDSCAERPCLATCPVQAFGTEGYDVGACTGHIASPAGKACLAEGCLARRVCPVGRQYHYPAEQARFHMSAFLAACRP